MPDKRAYTTTTSKEVMARIGDAMTSFDELSVAVPSLQFDLKSVYPISRLRDKTITEGGGAIVKGAGEFQITTDSAADSSARLQSVERGRYVAGFDSTPGIGLAVPTRPVGDQYIEWGYTDFENGFVVGEDAGGMYTGIYRDGVLVKQTRREDWDHPLTGYSEQKQLDPSHLTVYRMPFRWYGTGPFELKVSADIGLGGQEILAHTEFNPEPEDAITLDPNQPISVRVVNNGTTGNPLTAQVAGRQFYTHGDYNPNRRVTCACRENQTVGTDEFVPLIAFRQKINGYTTISTKLQGATVLTDEDLAWNIRVYAEVTDGVFEAPPFSDGGQETALDFNTTATTLAVDGVNVYGDIAPGGTANRSLADQSDLPDLDLPAQGDVVVLCAKSLGGTATVSSVFRAREEW